MVAKRHLKLRKTKKGKSMRGGSACSAAKESNKGMRGGSACAAAKENMRGGSLASSFVEDYANVKSHSQPLDEYQTEMGLPGMGNLTGGGCGCASSRMKGGKKSKRKGGKKGRKTKRGGWHQGGSYASASVAGAVPAVKSDSVDYEPASKVSGVHDMPNLYETTGGGAHVKGNKVMRGGSFWNFGGCGPANYPDAGRKYAHHFSKTSRCPGPEEIANPPGLGKAGSGDSADLSMGGTYPFV